MKNFILLLLISSFLYVSCGPKEHEGVPIEVKMKEEQAVWDVIEKYNEAYANKDFPGLVDYMSQDVVFFGTDSAEVIKSLAEYKEAMEKQWELYDSMVYGKIDEQDKFIEMDRNATLASVIFGAPLELTIDGKKATYFLRLHRTLKKENKRWLIVTGLVGIASTGQSTGDLLELIKSEKNKNNDEGTSTED
jgi:ketosteroid isomerase-like protein